MNILSFRQGHDSSAAIIKNGKIIADVAEERFTRIKNDSSFPINAIEYCLKQANIDSTAIDVVAIPSKDFINPAFFVFFSVPPEIAPKKYQRKIKKSSYFSSHSAPVLPLYKAPLPLASSCKIVTVEHHLAHAASACYTSGFSNEKSLVVTIDGSGDEVSAAMWSYDKGQISPLKKWGKDASLGWFYANATEALNWRHGSDEWKVMGLAPYGTPDVNRLKDFHPHFHNGELIKPHEYGEFGRWNDHGANHYHGQDAIELQKIADSMGHKDFAASVQKVSEDQALQLILPWLNKAQTRNLCAAGGFFLNVKLNQRLWYSGALDKFWVYPNAGDGGLPAGAALYAYHQLNPKLESFSLTDLYKGPSYSNEEIKEILDDRGLSYTYSENPSLQAAKYLSKNYVIGWFQGKMEAGPRALGNRSILMSPLKAENKDLINAKIKYREPFRPFAPSVLIEKAEDYFIKPKEERFMITSFDVKEEKKDKIPAVVHVDNTSRPNMVTENVNPRYYHLIKHFGEITGEPIILNTSLNIKGEPIINHPREAIKCFFDTGMDLMFVGNYCLKKPAVTDE